MDHSATQEFVHFEFTLENFVSRPYFYRRTEWLLLAVLCRPLRRHVLIKSNANG